MDQYKNLLTNIEKFVRLTTDEKKKLVSIITVRKIKKRQFRNYIHYDTF